MSTVYILGGGVAGLTAAHELAERGFQVVVFEKNGICGGKARSMRNPGTGTMGRQDWPAEHGFRFFPGFYWHLSDTMSRIWFDQANNIRVLDNLVPATEIGLAQEGKAPFVLPAQSPQTIPEWVGALRNLFEAPQLGVPIAEARLFMRKLFCFLGSGPTRRSERLERIPWWDYIEAAGKSVQYQCIFGRGLSRSLVAMRPEKGSTVTVMSMFVQIVINIVAGQKADRVLNGPTSEVWIDPWVNQLTGAGVVIHVNHKVVTVDYDAVGNHVSGVVVEDAAGTVSTWGSASDHYIAAMPVEIVNDDAIVSRPLKEAAGLVRATPGGDIGISQLTTDWMSGVLFYLNRNAAPLNGHVIYANSQWSLTSISQRQFWDVRAPAMGAYPWAQRGDGTAVDILSTIISAWDEAGTKTTAKEAKLCTKQEIFDETWAQLKAHLTLAGNGRLNDSDVVGKFLNPAIRFDPVTNIVDSNDEQLLINTADSRQHRPPAGTAVPNFFVASDYVATNTDLACMEAANEAARQAVNALLVRTGSATPPCVITPLTEPPAFTFFQTIDEQDYAANPGQEPLLCRYIDDLVPATIPWLSGSNLVRLIVSVVSLGILALILYLLLRS